VNVVTRSPWETRALAERLALLLEPGDVVVLEGDLGAGKTAFVQGVAAALGVDEPVQSPTFVIVREYDGLLPLVHIDVYRLDSPAQLADLGLEELLDGERVALIEWGDRVRALLPADRLEVVIELGAAAEERRLRIRGEGPGWYRRREDLDAVLSGSDSVGGEV
jgi:tRNA threonylcarbamoyladenosine biosynthesis protein TsaE